MKFCLALACVFLTFLLVKGTDDTSCSVTVWNEDNIESCPTKSLKVKRGCSVFGALQQAEKEDKNNFGLKSIKRSNKNCISKIGKWAENKEAKKCWFVYRLKDKPNNKKPPRAKDYCKDGVDDIIVKPNEHYLFWLRKDSECKYD